MKNCKTIWIDGKCKKCNCFVIETSLFDENDISIDNDIVKCADYKNSCTNPQCSEHYWHYVGDMEILDYYIHEI